MQTRQLLVLGIQRGESIPQYISYDLKAEMHAELEFMPGKRRSYFSQVMLGARLEGQGGGDILWRVFFVVFSSRDHRKHNIIQS
jgi:hypothetical protein